MYLLLLAVLSHETFVADVGEEEAFVDGDVGCVLVGGGVGGALVGVPFPPHVRLATCGGRMSPESTGRQEGLAKGFGPIVSQGHPFVGQGSIAGGMGRHEEEADLDPDGSLDLNIVHDVGPILPRSALGRRNKIRISRQDYRKISLVSSLLLRYTSSSYTHVMPHGQVYKA
jgi:hypothetical protein